jgi:dipeptide transport system substrate-binding protein
MINSRLAFGRLFGVTRIALMVFAAVAATIFFSPVGQAAEDTLRVRIGSDVGVLDPARIFGIENQTVAGHVYNGLVKYDQATNKLVPDLATEWSVSADGKAYTFKLRDGVKWHKGYGELTADDVKFSLDRVLDSKTKSRYAGQLAGVAGVDVVDKLTVRINLESPNAGLLNKLTAFNQGWIVSRKAVTEIGAKKYKMNPIGTGPFIFEKWRPGYEVSVVANKDYFGGEPKIGGVIFKLIKDETAAAIALENGEIDIFFALQQPVIIDRLRKSKTVTVHDRAANHTINLVMNMSKKPLDNLKVRKAIAFGINRAGLIDGYFKGTKAMGHSVLTSSFPEYTENVPQYLYNPAKAKQLLKEANVGDFTLELVTVGLSPYDQLIVPVASDLNKIGIKTKITVLERGAYLQARNKGEIMTCLTGVVGPPDPDSPLVTLYATKSFPPGLNTSRYKKADELLAKAAGEQDSGKRTGIYRQLLKQTMADVPVLPLYADRLFVAHSNKVKGFVQNSLFTMQSYSVSLN